MWNHFQSSGPKTDNHIWGLALLPKQAGKKSSSQPVWDYQAHQEWANVNRSSSQPGKSLDPRKKGVRHDGQIKKLVAEFSSGQKNTGLSALANTVVDFG